MRTASPQTDFGPRPRELADRVTILCQYRKKGQMPELKHETPSESELGAYLQEHFAGSVFACFEMPTEQLARRFSGDVARFFEALGRMDGLQFAHLAFNALMAGLTRMNSLPRNHPFWRNTNCPPQLTNSRNSAARRWLKILQIPRRY